MASCCLDFSSIGQSWTKIRLKRKMISLSLSQRWNNLFMSNIHSIWPNQKVYHPSKSSSNLQTLWKWSTFYILHTFWASRTNPRNHPLHPSHPNRHRRRPLRVSSSRAWKWYFALIFPNESRGTVGGTQNLLCLTKKQQRMGKNTENLWVILKSVLQRSEYNL